MAGTLDDGAAAGRRSPSAGSDLGLGPGSSPGLRPASEPPLDRFLRYVAIDTRSAEGRPTVPSSKGQWTLARLLVRELRHLGVRDVRLSEFGIVYATVPGNLRDGSTAPVIGLIAHLDTYYLLPGDGVRPIVHRDYRGGDIVLPADPSQVIRAADNPVLGTLIGDDIITADGTTLLGSDDKAGIAEIMTMIDILRQNPQIEHGTIAIAFTPDEEVLEGIKHFDIEGFGAQFAYTVDGDDLGSINDETWAARTARVTFTGVGAFPGTAKGVMVNAMYALGDFLSRFPEDMLPETTDGRAGFVHPLAGTADPETSSLTIALRDFEVSGLDHQARVLREMAAATQARFPRVRVAIEVKEFYRNMKEVVSAYPELTVKAMGAARRAGLEPRLAPIRGGTDGSKLNFMGLPTINLFTGGHNQHTKLEFNSRGGLEKSAETLVHLVQLFVT
jgi:tripeptide aminopeptidase